MLLSILEQAPTRRDAPPGQAFRDAIELARFADRSGFHRLWVAEHHALGGVAISAPEVVIPSLAAATSRLRIGSGGILLPNHRPIHVAEQFRTLEALHPGRIDLGVGRSEGSLDDAVVRAFARPDGSAHDGGFGDQLDELLAFGEVRPLPLDHPLASVRSGPRDAPLPPVFLLGSSVRSAVTAAERGLGYGFAAHTVPGVYAEALRAYRERFVPVLPGGRPHAILALKAMVGEDEDHARALAAPAHLGLVRARLGHDEPLLPVEEALRHRWTAEERAIAAEYVDERVDVVAGPDAARRQIEEMVAASGADEVIAIANTPEPDERHAALTRLQRAVGGGS